MTASKRKTSGDLRNTEREGYVHRSDESRTSELRDKQIRQRLSMEYRNILDMTPTPPDGVEYFWGRVDIKEGEPDANRIAQLNLVGWDPVPSDRHPELVMKDIFGRVGHTRGYICIRGLMLLERSTVYCDIERRKWENKNQNDLSLIPYADQFIGVRGMPASLNNTGTSFGPGPRSFGGF